MFGLSLEQVEILLIIVDACGTTYMYYIILVLAEAILLFGLITDTSRWMNHSAKPLTSTEVMQEHLLCCWTKIYKVLQLFFFFWLNLTYLFRKILLLFS